MNGARQHTSGCHTYVYELYPINQRNRASCNRGGHSIMIVRVYSLMAANLKLISRLIITVPRWTLRSRCHTLLRRGVLYFFLPLSLSLQCLPLFHLGFHPRPTLSSATIRRRVRPRLAHVDAVFFLAFLFLPPSIFLTQIFLSLSLSPHPFTLSIERTRPIEGFIPNDGTNDELH